MTKLKLFPQLLIAVPLVVGIVSRFVCGARLAEWLASATSLFGLIASGIFLGVITTHKPVNVLDVPGFAPQMFIFDGLTAFMAFLVSFIYFAVIMYSIGFMRHEVVAGNVPEDKVHDYYFKLHIFVAAMYMVVFLNNLGLVWAAIEATTLASAFLVGFYRGRESMEAAWKYLIICTVAIAISLLGIVILNHAIINITLLPGGTLDYTRLMMIYANHLDPQILKIAFIFVLVGYGTKAGLAPMHAWLPDAYSQSPTPVSALLSGVLMSCSIYALVRFTAVVNASVGVAFTSNLFVIFGLISLLISFPFIILQSDIKRLLAYSSVEHGGIIFLALGFGGKLGIAAAFYHIFNQAVLKSLLFFTSGAIIQIYKTRDLHVIKGLFERDRFLGVMLLGGGLGLAGMPPFGTFFSELMVLMAGIKGGWYFASGVYLALLTLVFIGFLNHLIKASFGHFQHEDFPGDMAEKACEHITELRMAIVMAALFCISIASGFYFWPPLGEAVMMAVGALSV